MHAQRPRKSAERRARVTSAADIAELSLKLAQAGDLRAATRAALLAERLQRLDGLVHKKCRAAEAAIKAARVDLAAAPPPQPSRVIYTKEQLTNARRASNIAAGLPADWKPAKIWNVPD